MQFKTTSSNKSPLLGPIVVQPPRNHLSQLRVNFEYARFSSGQGPICFNRFSDATSRSLAAMPEEDADKMMNQQSSPSGVQA